MTDYYDAQNAGLRNQVLQQAIDENKIKLAEQMRVHDAEAKARDIQTYYANQEQDQTAPVQQAYPGQDVQDLTQPQVAPQQPQGMIPQEGLTGFGGMSTPQQGPVGIQPQGDTTGLGGMQPTGWGEGQDQTQMQPTGWGEDQTQQPASPLGHEAALDQTTAAIELAASKVDKNKQIVDALHKAGLHDQADTYASKTAKLQQAVDTAALEHYKVGEKAAETLAKHLKGWLEVDDDPTMNSDAAWQRTILAAQADGFDTSEAMALPKDQRRAYATQMYQDAVSMKDQMNLEKSLMQEVSKNKRSEAANTSREKIADITNTRMAKAREITQDHWDKAQGLQIYKTQEKALRDNISIDQRNRTEYDGQVRDIDKQIAAIKSGNDLTVKRSERLNVIAELESQKATLVKARDSFTSNITSYEGSLKDLHNSFTNSGFKPRDLESVREVPSEASPTNPDLSAHVAEAQQVIAAGADPNIVAKRFKEHFGVDLDTAMASPTETPSVKPSAETAKPTTTAQAKPVAHLSPEAQKKADLDKLFLEKLNGTTVWEDVKDFGSGIKKSTNAFETFFQNKADSFNADVDSLAGMAKEKLQDKVFVSKLSPRALKNLKEMASDTGASHKAYQESQTPFELPFLGSASATAGAVGGRVATNRATNALVSTASKANSGPTMNASMATMKNTLKTLEEKAKAKELRAVGDTAKAEVDRIKEEIKLIKKAISMNKTVFE